MKLFFLLVVVGVWVNLNALLGFLLALLWVGFCIVEFVRVNYNNMNQEYKMAVILPTKLPDGKVIGTAVFESMEYLQDLLKRENDKLLK